MATSKASEETLLLYSDLLATIGLEQKGKNMPYTSINGNMYSFVAKEGYVAIRLSEDDKEAFMKKYNAGPAISYGATMRGYVHVPDDLLKKTKELSEYIRKSHEFAKTLKPKPTKKK
ncbi:hypothetical protein [Ekhidna sp. To15]|uniref:hypothetical protein n=1 Tax=Ekhidna sp. To15 TaxID=3395267 RepID=UPI003F528E69